MLIPKLQMALDNYELPSALGPLQKAHEHIDIIEAGTILCLAEGMHAVRILRSLYPHKPILADVRIAEAGSLIAKMAFEAGASWVSVVSGATLTTVDAVLNQAARWQGEVQVELIDPWTYEQAREWRAMGVQQIITHRSRDAEAKGQQTWSAQDLDDIRRLADMGFLVTVTGGVTLEDIPRFAGAPVGIFIAGRAIRDADDPALAARAFQEAIARTFAPTTA
ncbi:MAG: 3-keto-L-gulonate-6-phosphate decarboxylase UlaD [Anaerolineae bacterium]|nr:3-keto-L-gulonate-6-phosphate decarboxylase UlaD [Anaerolineae bacterium]